MQCRCSVSYQRAPVHHSNVMTSVQWPSYPTYQTYHVPGVRLVGISDAPRKPHASHLPPHRCSGGNSCGGGRPCRSRFAVGRQNEFGYNICEVAAVLRAGAVVRDWPAPHSGAAGSGNATTAVPQPSMQGQNQHQNWPCEERRCIYAFPDRYFCRFWRERGGGEGVGVEAVYV